PPPPDETLMPPATRHAPPTPPPAPATPTLSLPDALPISGCSRRPSRASSSWGPETAASSTPIPRSWACWASHERGIGVDDAAVRSEEHTSELQSRGQLVCRLLRAGK